MTSFVCSTISMFLDASLRFFNHRFLRLFNLNELIRKWDPKLFVRETIRIFSMLVNPHSWRSLNKKLKLCLETCFNNNWLKLFIWTAVYVPVKKKRLKVFIMGPSGVVEGLKLLTNTCCWNARPTSEKVIKFTFNWSTRTQKMTI